MDNSHGTSSSSSSLLQYRESCYAIFKSGWDTSCLTCRRRTVGGPGITLAFDADCWARGIRRSILAPPWPWPQPYRQLSGLQDTLALAYLRVKDLIVENGPVAVGLACWTACSIARPSNKGVASFVQGLESYVHNINLILLSRAAQSVSRGKLGTASV